MTYTYDNPLLFAKMEKEGEIVEVRLYETGGDNEFWRASRRFVSDNEPQRFSAMTGPTYWTMRGEFYKMVGGLIMEGFVLITKEVNNAPVSQGSGIPF